MGKRGRTFFDITDSFDGPVSYRRVGQSLTCVGDGTDSQGSKSHMKCGEGGDVQSLTASSLTADLGDSQRSTRSAFTTEIFFFFKEEEELADMSLYLARTVSSAKTPDALIALVKHFLKYDADVVMLSLKHASMQSKFFEFLCKVPIYEIEEYHRKLFFCFFVFLVRLSDTLVICDEVVINFLLQSCRQGPLCTPETPSAHRAPSHWSQRARRLTVASPRQPGAVAELKTCVDALCGCGCESDTTVVSLALQLLLYIIFEQNSSTLRPVDANVCLTFAELGGFDVVSAFIHSEESGDVLHLLETVTLCEEIRGLYAAELQRTAFCLVRFITGGKEKSNTAKNVYFDDINAALRVLTNLTGLIPSLLSSSIEDSKALATFSAAMLTSVDTMPDTVAFVLCFTTNIVRWEAAEKLCKFTCFLVNDPQFLTRVASLTFGAYNSEDMEKNVLGGYYALFLAVLSLCDSPELQLRVPVMMAVADAARGTAALKKVENSPMALIVAILQEFMFFKSSAGSLTKDALVSMSTIIDSVVKNNGIEISSDD